MKILFYISIIVLFFSSCEKDADVKIPQQEPKLSVSSFIRPGATEIEVFVYLSEPVFSSSASNGNTVNNAVVTLSNGVNSITIGYDANTGSYKASLATFPILHNTTYYLSVLDAQGRHVTAKTTTPSAVDPSYDVTRSSTTDPYNNITYQINCIIHDISGEENYYRVTPAEVFYHASQADTAVNTQGRNIFVNDRAGDGADLNTSMQIYSFNSSGQDSATYKAHRVMVVKANQDYYNFHNSVFTASMTNGNPFAEPTIIYSNVQGGYGCFGAYTSTYKELPY